MTTKSPWKKPVLKSFGTMDHVEQRITTIQRRLAILHNNEKLNPDPENRESIAVYTKELARLQKKYKIILILSSHAN